MSWYENGYFAFDTETTGVNDSTDRIVSAAILHYNNNQVIDTTQWLINPGIDIPEAASAVNGITTEHVQANGAPAPSAIAEILQTIAKLSKTSPV